MGKIKVSVIIPIYKVENYIDKTISSVVAQSIDGLEIILVDDGSPDSCPEKIDQWQQKDDRIKAIHKQNEGVTIARQTGLNHASGEYVFFLDGDDYLVPDCLKLLYEAAKQNNADWVTSDFIIESPEGKQTHRHFNDFGKTDTVGFIKYCYSQPDFYFTSRLIRHSLIDNAKLEIPSTITYGEDNIAVTQLGSQLKCAIKVDCVSLVYVQRADSVTGRCSRKDMEQRANACKICYDWLIKMPFFKDVKRDVEQYFISEYIASLKQGYVPDIFDFVKTNCQIIPSSHTFFSRIIYASSSINLGVTQKLISFVRKVLGK